MLINLIKPTQNTIRSIQSIFYHINKYVTTGTIEPMIIKQVGHELYLHDGLHRLCALHICGLEELQSNMYILKHFTLQQFTQVNFNVGWVTPLDLQNECRKADISRWKYDINNMLKHQPTNIVEHYIYSHRDKYCEPRIVQNVKEVVERL